MHIPASDKQVAFYNLDVAISVGYRVNSKRGTKFPIWATQVLRDHIIRGYSVNEKRLRQLRQSIKLIGQVLSQRKLPSDEAAALLRVVSDHEKAVDLIDGYDHQNVKPVESSAAAIPITFDEAETVIDALRRRFKASELFGREKDKSQESGLSTIFQTYGAWSERLKELKKGKQRDEAAVAEAEAGVKGVSREAKELFAKAKKIEDAVYDLKAVNPNKKPALDTRIPEELIDIIEAKDREIAKVLAMF